MRILCWNCRGLGSDATVGELRWLLRAHRPSLLFLSETKMRDTRVRSFMWSLGYSGCYAVSSVGLSGGLALFWLSSVSVSVKPSNARCIDVHINPENAIKWRATFVYGEPRRELRSEFWDFLRFMRAQWDGPWLCCGDFNEVLGAVQRHGAAAWDAVAAELRSRSPCSFSPEECEAKFSEIQARYSASDAWFDELRNQRVAELRRELRKSESFIGSLQSVIESLSNSKRDDSNSGCHTESRSRNENAADTNSSSKELSKDRSSAASFTEEASNSQKSQNVQNISAETLSKPHVEKKLCAKDGLLWGSRKKRGLRDKRAILMADDSSRDGENTSTSCIQREGSSEGRMKGLKIPKVEPGVSVCERTKPSLADIVNTISTQGDCNMLQRQIDFQRKRARYKKMIRQHMDFRILRTKIKNGVISSTKELLKDMLLFVNNVLAFYPKATLEHMAAVELRGLICKTLQQSSSVLPSGCGAAGVATDPVIKKTAAMISSDTVIKKTTARTASDPVIKKTTAGIARDPVVKKATAGVAREPVIKKATAGIAKDPVMKKKATAGIARDPVMKKAVTGMASDPVIKKEPEEIASEPVIKKAAAVIGSEPVIKKSTAGVASAPVVKKIARTLPAVRHVPRDAKRSKVSSVDSGSSVSQAEPKVVPGDAAPTSNEKPVQGSPPAKKRGVGRPPKSGQKRPAPQQDSPSKGRKKTRR